VPRFFTPEDEDRSGLENTVFFEYQTTDKVQKLTDAVTESITRVMSKPRFKNFIEIWEQVG
jgi:hypothetical protein